MLSKEKLRAMLTELTKWIKTEKDLSNLAQQLINLQGNVRYGRPPLFKVPEQVLDEILIWQNRLLITVYFIVYVYLDCIVLKIRHDKRVVNMECNKELLG